MYYFAYGSNLSKEQMLERCPDSQPRFTATLHNYRLVFAGWSRKWRGSTATLKSFRGKKVPGAIYEISEDCLRRLDKHEGYGVTHDRFNVIVNNEDGDPVEAVTYFISGRIQETPPSNDYVAIMQQGYRDWGIF